LTAAGLKPWSNLSGVPAVIAYEIELKNCTRIPRISTIYKNMVEMCMEFPPIFHPEFPPEKSRKNKAEVLCLKMRSEQLERYHEIADSIPKELQLKLLTQITSGLLASGHFTCEEDEPGEDYHFQLKVRCYELDPGKLEKDSTVVAVAERLLREIIETTYVAEIYDTGDEQETSSNHPNSS
jgi:hypothetical protein